MPLKTFYFVPGEDVIITTTIINDNDEKRNNKRMKGNQNISWNVMIHYDLALGILV